MLFVGINWRKCGRTSSMDSMENFEDLIIDGLYPVNLKKISSAVRMDDGIEPAVRLLVEHVLLAVLREWDDHGDVLPVCRSIRRDEVDLKERLMMLWEAMADADPG